MNEIKVHYLCSYFLNKFLFHKTAAVQKRNIVDENRAFQSNCTVDYFSVYIKMVAVCVNYNENRPNSIFERLQY